MKNLLSSWSGRLIALIFPAALVASFLAPSKALAIQYMSLGGRDPGSLEGDPMDNNDYGGGGGGSDVHDDSGSGGSPIPLVFGFDHIQILMVPEFIGGKIVFRILIVERPDSGVTGLSLEGTYAP